MAFGEGSTAMRIAGRALDRAFSDLRAHARGSATVSPDSRSETKYYGIAIEGDRMHFAWGDLNSAGATRVRAGLERLQHAVGWDRKDGGGIVGKFVEAVRSSGDGRAFLDRIRHAAAEAYAEVSADPQMPVNDAIDIADFVDERFELATDAGVQGGTELGVVLPRKVCGVKVLERRTGFIARLSIDGVEHKASVSEFGDSLQVKLRMRKVVVSAAVCILSMTRDELGGMLDIVREDNDLDPDAPIDIVGFLRHIADILLLDEIKSPAKIERALGANYDAANFVRAYSLEDVRERFPGILRSRASQPARRGADGVDRHLEDADRSDDAHAHAPARVANAEGASIRGLATPAPARVGLCRLAAGGAMIVVAERVASRASSASQNHDRSGKAARNVRRHHRAARRT